MQRSFSSSFFCVRVFNGYSHWWCVYSRWSSRPYYLLADEKGKRLRVALTGSCQELDQYMDGGVYDDIHQRVVSFFFSSSSSSEKKKNKQTRTITIYVIGPRLGTHMQRPIGVIQRIPPYANDPSQVDFVRRGCVCVVSVVDLVMVVNNKT